jgi:GT2 family glycosyltransferase
MFDFMGFGLPTITTEVGARGIETAGRNVFKIVAPRAEAFVQAVHELESPDARHAMAEAARKCVEDGYAWERISKFTGQLLQTRHASGRQPPPMFSVVVPTYERHDQLDALMAALQQQIERDFEVVVIDQSQVPWPNAERSHGFRLTYFHTTVKGAVRARNTGAALAQGLVIAFTDDDCLPAPDWLLNARPYFADSDVVGVEGLIRSDHLNEPDWRPVTNVGFEGLGFMTANLLVRSECLQLLGGFDLQFDHPHFREDTDFGWRLQEIGGVPYAKDVVVYHPAQLRDNYRESLEARVKFFEKDALLYRKHPGKYRVLFEAEEHYLHTTGFLSALETGFRKIQQPVPDWILSYADD